DAVDLLIASGRTIDAIRMDGWRTDIGYPEDRDRAEERLLAERDEAASGDGEDGEAVEAAPSDES
ncbi:MAG: UTP--glucose-1-phosphate uridylyltransferase, partial [Haloferacaceae archaeon]